MLIFKIGKTAYICVRKNWWDTELEKKYQEIVEPASIDEIYSTCRTITIEQGFEQGVKKDIRKEELKKILETIIEEENWCPVLLLKRENGGRTWQIVISKEDTYQKVKEIGGIIL